MAGVGIGESVLVGGGVSVAVVVGLLLAVAVIVGVGVMVGLFVGVSVGTVGLLVGVSVEVLVAVLLAVGVGVVVGSLASAAVGVNGVRISDDKTHKTSRGFIQRPTIQAHPRAGCASSQLVAYRALGGRRSRNVLDMYLRPYRVSPVCGGTAVYFDLSGLSLTPFLACVYVCHCLASRRCRARVKADEHDNATCTTDDGTLSISRGKGFSGALSSRRRRAAAARERIVVTPKQAA